VLVTESVAEAAQSEHLRFDPIGEVSLKGFPEPIHLLVAQAANL